jgi:hypothetical protein
VSPSRFYQVRARLAVEVSMGWSGVLDGLERRSRQPARSPLSVPRREVPHRLTARVVDGDSRRAEEPDDWLSVVAGAAAADAERPDRPRLREDVAQGWRSYLDPSSPESG